MGKSLFRLPHRPAWMTLRARFEERSFDDHLETKLSIQRREEAFHLGVPEPARILRPGDGFRK